MCVTRPFRSIYVNGFDRLFFLRSAQNCKKCTFLGNLRAITQEGNMEIRQITPFFIYFIYVWIWKYSKFIFMRSILVCKMPQFLTKSYQLEQLIIFFKKIFIIFCPPGGAKYQFCSLYLMNYYSYVKYNPQCFWLDDCPLDKVVATLCQRPLR